MRLQPKLILREMLSTPRFRTLIGRMRFHYYVHWRKRLRSLSSDLAYDTTIDHNLKGLGDHTNLRMDKLIKPLLAIETLDLSSKILVIGPRTESDILHLIGCGFHRPNVRGLDLLSYSPYVELGDMHKMPYPDSAWDATLSGFCISYSKEPKRVADEMVRVTKPGGIIAIGIEYSELTASDQTQLLGYTIEAGNETVLNSTQDILALFDGKVDRVYFEHDAPRKISHSATKLSPNVSTIAVIFSIRK